MARDNGAGAGTVKGVGAVDPGGINDDVTPDDVDLTLLFTLPFVAFGVVVATIFSPFNRC